MSTLIQERVELARRGLSPHVICRLKSGWAVLGDSQSIAGYCLLLPDPVVPSLNDVHIFPRRISEPGEYRFGPVFAYPKADRESRPFDPARDDRLLRSLRDFLKTNGHSRL
jgi:hypothetical protein